jgi:hypothetical protein
VRWPDDRSWFVGLPIYTNEIAVAGTAAMADALLVAPRLDARRATSDDVFDGASRMLLTASTAIRNPRRPLQQDSRSRDHRSTTRVGSRMALMTCRMMSREPQRREVPDSSRRSTLPAVVTPLGEPARDLVDVEVAVELDVFDSNGMKCARM